MEIVLRLTFMQSRRCPGGMDRTNNNVLRSMRRESGGLELSWTSYDRWRIKKGSRRVMLDKWLMLSSSYSSRMEISTQVEKERETWQTDILLSSFFVLSSIQTWPSCHGGQTSASLRLPSFSSFFSACVCLSTLSLRLRFGVKRYCRDGRQQSTEPSHLFPSRYHHLRHGKGCLSL